VTQPSTRRVGSEKFIRGNLRMADRCEQDRRTLGGLGAGLYCRRVARMIIGSLSDFPEATGIRVESGGLRVAVFRVGERVFAVEDRCAHRGFPLSDGVVSGATIRCRTHGACFDLATGAPLRGPANRPIRVFSVEIVGSEVALILPD
jgi:3-phenylpropionate/trans-cinnamate dioxygenase ferredoxin subunit